MLSFYINQKGGFMIISLQKKIFWKIFTNKATSGKYKGMLFKDIKKIILAEMRIKGENKC